MAEIDSAPSLKAVSRDKKSASVRQADVPTNFSPIDPDISLSNTTLYSDEGNSYELYLQTTSVWLLAQWSPEIL